MAFELQHGKYVDTTDDPIVEYPRWSSIAGVLDKPALIGWAVRLATDYGRVNFREGMTQSYHDELMKDAANNWRDMAQQAMDIGTEVHALINQHISAKIKGEHFDTAAESRDEVTNAFLAFLDWEEKNIDDYVASELIILDKVHGYGGTIDAVAHLKNGKLYVIDFKSSSGFWPEYPLQISAYRGALIGGAEGMGILRLDKQTGQPEWKDYSDVYDRMLEAVHALTDFYYLFKKRRLKNNPLAEHK